MPTIRVYPNDTRYGSTSPYGSVTVSSGGSLTMTATAASGYHFTQWVRDDGGYSTSNPYTARNLTTNHTYTAYFEPNASSITIRVYPNDANWGSVSGGGTYTSGSSVTLTATPRSGYRFVKWVRDDGGESTDNPYTRTMTASHTYTAYFEAIPVTRYTVNVYPNDANWGTVSPSGAQTVNEGSTLTLTATPRDGYSFKEWRWGDTVVSTNATYTTPGINSNRTYIAYFARTYSVTIGRKDGEGSIQGVRSYADGATVTLTAYPEQGWVFEGWGVEGWGKTNPYTFTIHSNVVINPRFEPLLYSIYYYQDSSTLWKTEQKQYNVAYTITSSTPSIHASSELIHWNTQPNDTGTSYNAGDRYGTNASLTLYAIWRTHSITKDVGEGIDSITAPSSAVRGDTVQVSATPNQYYESDATLWSVTTSTGTSVPFTRISANVISFTMSNSNVTVRAWNPTKKQYKITARLHQPGIGHIEIDGVNMRDGGTVYKTYGESVTIQAFTGKKTLVFSYWDRNGTHISSNPYSFSPSSDVLYEAYFSNAPGPSKVRIDTYAEPEHAGYTSGSGTYTYGSKVELNAVPGELHRFVEWDNGVQDAQYRFNAYKSQTIKGLFERWPNIFVGASRVKAVFLGATPIQAIKLGETNVYLY